MPNFALYPTALDVEVMFKSTGYWPTDANKQALAREQAESAAAAAAREWETATGWHPFLSTSDVTTTRTFRPSMHRFGSTGVLMLDAGLLSLDSVTINGQAVVANAIIPKPDNALAQNAPYTWLYFPMSRQWGTRWSPTALPPTVAVTGRFGYSTTCPPDAWQQILQAAGMVALTQVENLQSLASLSMDGFSKAYDVVGIITQKDTVERWKREFDKIAARYRRVIS